MLSHSKLYKNKESEIVRAVKANDIATIKRLLFQPLNPAEQIPFYRGIGNSGPLLHDMVRYINDDDLVELLPVLLEKGYFLWWYSFVNETPLMFAVVYGKIRALTFLLENEEKIRAIFAEKSQPFERMIEQKSNAGYALIHYAVTLLTDVAAPPQPKQINAIQMAQQQPIPASRLQNPMVQQPPQPRKSRPSIPISIVRSIFDVLIKHGASYLQRCEEGITAAQYLYQAIPQNPDNLQLWKEITTSFAAPRVGEAIPKDVEKEKEPEKSGLLASLTNKDKLSIIYNIGKQIGDSEKFDFSYVETLQSILNSYDNIAKLKLTIRTCTIFFDLYCNHNKIDNYLLDAIYFLAQDANLDLQEHISPRKIQEILINLYNQLFANGLFYNASARLYWSGFDKYLFFVRASFPRIYTACLQDLYLKTGKTPEVIAKFVMIRLINHYGLGIGFAFNAKTFPKQLLSRYFEQFAISDFLAIGTTPPKSKKLWFFLNWYKPHAITSQNIDTKKEYSQSEIISNLHILVAILISPRNLLEHNTGAVTEVKAAFFYFLSRITTLASQPDAKGHDAKLIPLPELSFHQLMDFPSAVKHTIKMLLGNMNTLSAHFTASERIALQRIIHGRFPTLMDMCVNQICEMEEPYPQGTITMEDADSLIKAIHWSESVHSQSRFLARLGLFPRTKTEDLEEENSLCAEFSNFKIG